ncbi:hypothetical protein DY000_02047546 [Brassica cretica]|uniref:Secreted protein n=1 Tax=Brassica cretica TaxID=69181 RepID=A0ABQ7F7H3_BRACR|nr:hypothetical protein DY000_02047546 [Brassica cretica]
MGAPCCSTCCAANSAAACRAASCVLMAAVVDDSIVLILRVLRWIDNKQWRSGLQGSPSTVISTFAD